MKWNTKGQFSIVAALLVAVVLIAAVMTTYSSIRYTPVQGQPQILSAVDETNLGLKEMLCFTVGYYGSVLKVTGNMSYAQQLATNYLKSSLNKLGQIRPEWGTNFNLTSLSLSASWFSNKSYSAGTLSVNYNLTGLGISGVSYSTSTRLDVEISNASSASQAQLSILMDDNQPLINLGKSNLQFYSYDYQASTWGLTPPTNIASYANGTYIIDLPLTLLASSYIIQVQDTRGLMVLASSFTQVTSTLTWNTTGFQTGLDYVDIANSNVLGTHSNFAAQQSGPDSVFDAITEELAGTFTEDYYPTDCNPLDQTSSVSGTLTDLQSDNSTYMQLRSYPTSFSSSYNTIEFDSQSSAILTSQARSISWTHTTGVGDDRILLVSVDLFTRSGTPTVIQSITYDGIALTQVATTLCGSDPQIRSYVYSIVNPSPGSKTINVNFAENTYVIGGAVVYTNVNQTTPILANSVNTGSSSSPTVSLTASGTNDKMLYGHLGAQSTSSYTMSDVAPLAYRWTKSGSYWYWRTDTTYYLGGRGSDKSVTSGPVSASWTTTSSVRWTAIAVLLQPTQVGTAYVCAAEFTGSSNTNDWNNIVWTIDGSATNSGVSVTYQLFNYVTGQYTLVGDGYLTDTLETGDRTKTQTITSSLTDYRDGSGNWKIKINATQTTSTRFTVKLDLIQYSVNEDNYALNLEEQWLNVNASNPRQDLCIKTGNMDPESLIVQVYHGGSWQNLMTLYPNYFNNVSLAPYIDSTTLTIRFVGSNDVADISPDSWDIDSVYLKDAPDIKFLVNLQESTFTLEILQNGTMRWLGQNRQLTTQTLPIPPIPVKAIHVNQTKGGVNQEVPFQIEDWASEYQIPLGLTSNTTVFSNRQMIVFLLNSSVTDFTIWWDGSDSAVQTSLVYTNTCFHDSATSLNNGKITLTPSTDSAFTITSQVNGKSTSSTTTFMRINTEASTYGAGSAYVICNGTVRDIIQQEAEWGRTNPPTDDGGAHDCPNLYASIVLTLPAGVSYYTYQLRCMFINSAPTRTISEMCPIKVSTNVSPAQAQTENGTLANFPIVQNGTATFSNYTSGGWTAHHFSQLISEAGNGAGIIFTDIANQKLYAFNSFPSSTSIGALKTSTGLIELLPVSSGQVQFTNAYDIAWVGAVATFDGTTPVCRLYDGTTPMGLWILAEYPPTITVTAKS